MNFARGAPINLVQKFWKVDPITKASVLTNPTTVTFVITDPEGAVTSLEWPGSPSITNPEPGVFVCLRSPPSPVGIYHYYAAGTGDVQAQSPEETFEVIENEETTPDPPTVAVQGPCTQWISGQDVADCTGIAYNDQPWIFDNVAFNASAALYQVSGRQFPGVCERTVRPARTSCSCWSMPSSGFGPYWWTGTVWGFGGPPGWYNQRGDRLGCDPMSRVRLAGYPVREILEVKIDGTVLPEFDPGSGARNWRLDDWRWLTRMNTPAAAGVPMTPNFWPGCQDMSLDDTETGTFSIKYRWGSDVPDLGKSAAVEIANQLFLACGGSACTLPPGVTKVVRQGIEIDRGLLANWIDQSKPTGLINTDLFIAAYCQGQRRGRRSAVWSPDQQQFARRLGV